MTGQTRKDAQPPVKFWTPLRVASTLIVLALIAAFGASSCSRQPSEPPGDAGGANSSAAKTGSATSGGAPAAPAVPPAPVPLSPAMLSTELKTIDGRSFKLSDYAGKVVVVNLWATWCGPCRIEIPHLIQLYTDFKDRGLELVGLTNEDPTDDADKVKGFVREQKINYRVGWTSQEFALGLMQGNVRNSIPQSFVITRDGRVFKRFIGFSPTQTPPQLRTAVEQALAQ